MQGDGEVLFLGGVGEVAVTLGHDGLSFLPLHPELGSSCLSSIGLLPKLENKIKFSDVYAVELLDEGPVCGPWNTRIVAQGKKNSEMHRFAVHVITRSRKHPSQLVPCEYLFGHKDPETCKSWVEHLSACINNEQDRPKNLMVFVHPLCGKGRGCKNWEMVAPLFDRAKVNTKVIITERAGHAYDTLASISDKELKKFDGVVAVGGDGLFNEILNGLLNSRNKISYPPTPEGFGYFGSTEKCQGYRNDGLNNSTATSDAVNVMLRVGSNKSDDHEPLLSTGKSVVGLDISSLNPNTESSTGDQVPPVFFPNDWFRLGIIPSGSTDAIVLRYGFYGEVIRESENYRWMGPARYDFSGTMVFLKHRSYDAKVAFLENENSHSFAASAENVADEVQPLQSRRKRSRKTICQANCSVCKETSMPGQNSEDEIPNSSQTIHNNPKWIWSEGRFLSVGAAVISCRNERAPDGLVAEAHLSDGFLHLLLIRDCPLPLYLCRSICRHLTQFTKKGSDPLTFKFVEHHKTRAFTFISSHDESVWNLDGELFQACEVSVQACRGLVNLFASGPEV
ncbi:ceramide kinase-like isoform X3 [Triticum dicoccoides]|uniref:ceramide kinase-like isoform X3 n=1 Tax=Triticum dicoccoides TaxID=85692 RepID=UPI0018914DD2|nr:ceramide kinase-like isoform X3 [Triticum dicoccoides]